MKIIFKEVGQGDSIILEWVDEGAKKIAIIDSNLKGSANPVLEHIKTLDLSAIEFILLTHPHYDHFSGLLQILEYCELRDVVVKLFLHTSSNIPEFLISSVRGHVAKGELERLFLKVQELLDNGLIKDCGFVDSLTREIVIGDGWALKVLAPSSKEIRNFNKGKYKESLETSTNSSIGNLLSTLLKIQKEDEFLLLTSDVIRGVFEGHYNKGMQDFKDQILLGQIPHHGASSNFFKDFWKSFQNKKDKPVAISVGPNAYKHPSANVIEALQKMRYKIDITNEIKNIDIKPSSLDLISTVAESVSFRQVSRSQDLMYEF